MEQGEAAVKRAPVLRAGMTFRPLSEGRVYISHPAVASQVLDARVGAALEVCHGQPLAELLPEVRRLIEYDCTEEEWSAFLEQLAGYGFFEGTRNRSPRVRLFDPAPALDFLTVNFRWLFTPYAVAALFLLLLAGLWCLIGHWDLFLSEVLRITVAHPFLAVFLYYLCFLPVGLLHELAHGVVCRWFGGEVLEVGLRKDSANLYVLSNTAALKSDRARILYFAGGAFLDMFIFFVLVNVWLRWPNFVTLMFLLPQAMFVLQFSYAMEGGSDLSKIISQWTHVPEAQGRTAFLRGLFTKLPGTPKERTRAAIYVCSILLQGCVAAFLIWSFRRPAEVTLWPGVVLAVPFWPVILYVIYRSLRWTLMNFQSVIRKLSPAKA